MIIINPNADYSQLGLGKIFAPITPEVEDIMAHYSTANSRMKYAMAAFLDDIDSIKSKIKSTFFPLFAKNATEALYDFATDNTIYPSGFSAAPSTLRLGDANKLLLNTQTDATYWQRYTWTKNALYGSNDLDGTFGIMQILVLPVSDSSQFQFCGETYLRTSSVLGTVPPASTYNKLRGVVFRGMSSGSGTITEFTDTGDADKTLTSASLNTSITPFGNIYSSLSENAGVRVSVQFAGTTKEEEKLLRAAMLKLDNAFFI